MTEAPITVTLSSSGLDDDGFIRQTITDGKKTGHRLWKPGTTGPAAAWTDGPAPWDDETHLIVRTVLTPVERKTWRGPTHTAAYSVRNRLEEMRQSGEQPADVDSPLGEVVDVLSGLDFSALVPAKKKCEKVTFHGQPAFDVLDTAAAKQRTVLVEGETGEGKTFVPEQWAALHGWPVVKVSGNAGASPEKFLGYDVIRNGSVVPQFGLIPQALQYALDHPESGVVLLLDEYGFFPPEMLTPLFPVLDGSRLLTLEFGGGITLPVAPNVLIVGTNNPGYEGVFAENHALRRRWQYRIQHSLPEAVIKKMVPQAGVREAAMKLRTAFQNEQVSQWLPLPTILEFVEFAEDHGVQFAMDNLVGLYLDRADRQVARDTLETLRSNIEADFRPADESAPAAEDAAEAEAVADQNIFQGL